MKIIADKNILFVKDAFSEFGEVITYTTRITDKSILKDADALLTRSTMKINETLLENSNLKFIATATAGTEHLDTGYLKKRNIYFADAKGSNANSVSEYVVAALLSLADEFEFNLKGKSLGIIGHGNVGKKVEEKAKALGLEIILNDPPLKELTDDPKYLSIDEALNCDIVTVHVPLTKEGKHKTLYLMDEKNLSKMKKGSILINSCRGKVVDEKALTEKIASNHFSHTIFDVWENEPHINADLINNISIATPHIAGHSFDGKVNGTIMVLNEFCKFFNLKSTWEYDKVLHNSVQPIYSINENEPNDEKLLLNVIKRAYDIIFDDSEFRKIRLLQPEDRSKYFDKLRSEYRARREFVNFSVDLKNEHILNIFRQLGFTTKIGK